MHVHIKSVCKMIAHDAGAMGREEAGRWEEVYAEVFGADGVYGEEVDLLEAWLAGLTEYQRETVAIGEHSEAHAIVVDENCPLSSEGHPLTGLFEDFFESL